MATTVGSHSVSAFATPVNGGPLDANVVRGNDNTIRTAYVAHDADTGIHVQSSTLASRPAAGTAGRKWITADTGSYKLWYDDGTTWHEVAAGNIDVFVIAGESLAKGDVVKVTGYNTGTGAPTVAKVSSASDTAFGIVTSTTIANGATGYITNTGLVQDVNTNSFSIGNILYPNTSGGLTATKPTSGTYQVVAYVLRSNQNNGVLYVEFSAPRIVERSDNTASTVVLRDASGDFAAGTITATAVNTTTIDLTNLEVTNIKAKDGTASATIADSTGVMTIASSVLTTTDINGGTIDGTVIGGASAAAGTFTTATATTGNITTVNATTVNTTTLDLTNLEVTNIKAKDGTAAATIADSTGKITVSTELAVDNLNLSGNAITSTDTNGNIDLTPNGTGEVNITKVDIDSGTIDGTTIGGSSAAAGTFTTVAATTGNITTVNATTVDTTSIEVTNVKAKDGTASIAIADSTGVATITAAPVLSALTASQAVFTDSNKALVSNAITGTGNVVMSASPTLTGTITAADLSMSGTLTLGTDVALSRGAANRLDVATGDSVNLVSGSYLIGGTSVLSSTTLGTGITASSLTSVGTLTSLTVSGDLTVDTSTLKVDSTNNRVGIGTASPSQTLTVSGSSNSGSASTFPALTVANTLATQGDGSSTFNFSSVYISSGNAASQMILSSSYAAGTWEPQGLINVSTNHPLVFRTNNTERMRLDAVGRLGVGETSPGARIHIKGTGVDAAIDLESSTATTGKRMRVVSLSSGGLAIEDITANVSRFIIDSSGNGILGSTSTPTGQASNNRVLQLYGAGTSNRAQIHFTNSDTGETASDGTFIGVDSSKNFYVVNAESAATVFENNGGEALRITSAKELLVGEATNSSSGAIVSVVQTGTGNAEGMRVASSASFSCFAVNAKKADFADNVYFGTAARAANSAYNFFKGMSDNGVDTEFLLRGDGNGYADGTWNNNGADYAEYFESATGAALTVGATVVLDGNKIREATEEDAPSAIVGVVRPKAPGKASMVVGNTAWNKWSNKYLTDDFDCYVMEAHEVVEWTDEDGKAHSYESHRIPDDVVVPEDAVRKTHDDKGNPFEHYKLNPAYDPSVEYVPREKRDEWVIVGLVGQVKVLKGQPVNDRWVKMRDVSAAVEEWMIR